MRLYYSPHLREPKTQPTFENTANAIANRVKRHPISFAGSVYMASRLRMAKTETRTAGQQI